MSNFSNSTQVFWIFLVPLVLVAMGQGCGDFKLAETSQDLGSRLGASFSPSAVPGLRMLSVREYDNSVEVLLGENQSIGAAHLPEDVFSPFDTSTENMAVSDVRIRGLEAAAAAIVTRFLAAPARMAQHLPCIPKDTKDQECFRRVVTEVGKLAFRRPLSAEEVERFLLPTMDFATKGQTVQSGLEVFLKVVLQHPNFLFRWEVGRRSTRSNDLFELDDYELASRLAFTLWGTIPDRQLLAAAAQGKLRDPKGYEQVVDEMLNNERALRQIDFFHSAWFGYNSLNQQNELARMMRQETSALLRRVVFQENRPWQELLAFDETFVTRTLAAHYGIAAPVGDSGWVKYGSSERRGLFSHGTFLSVGGKFGDTSPVQRGYSIRKNVFCEGIPPPPPGLDIDEPPMGDTPSRCKEDQHRASTMRAGTSCVGCHRQMDPIGFGLERYDVLGAFRTQERTFTECKISGNGEVIGYGSFNGPAELGRVAASSGRVERCLVERWVQLSYGREKGDVDEPTIVRHLNEFKKTGRLKDWIRAFVVSADFRYRQDEVK